MNRTLFHFSRGEYAASILNNGIKMCRIPLEEGVVMAGICLTEIGDPYEQHWAFPDDSGDCSYRISLRFTISVPESPRLMKWRHFARTFGISPKNYRELTRSGNGHPYKWYVYLDKIPASWITQVWCTKYSRYLNLDEVSNLKGGCITSGQYAHDENCLTEEAARMRSLNKRQFSEKI
jgi:hypothetical protein